MPSIQEVDDDFSDPEDLPLDPIQSPPPSALADFNSTKYKTVESDVYKGWETIYPIYLDAKQPHARGARRVSKKLALQWPLAEHMAQGCSRLGVESVFEPQKTHPKNWANPGRVKVHLKHEGSPIHAAIKNKTVLLKKLAILLAPLQPSSSLSTTGSPSPLPPIHLRLPINSPAVSQGILANAASGGGMGGMLGNLLGGGGNPASVEEEEAAKPKEGPKVIKPRKVHIKKKR